MVISGRGRLGRKKLYAVLFFLACLCAGGCGLWKTKVYRVGIISGGEAFASIADGFKKKMSELGYEEGKNIIYEVGKSATDKAADERIIKQFVTDKVDLIFAFPTEAAQLAKIYAREANIPVVFAMAGIDGNDLVESVRHPGGNITGVRFPNKESTVKRLEILHELVPNAKRVYLLYDPDFPNAPFAISALRQAAVPYGITFVEDFAKNLEEYKLALQKRSALDDAGVDAVFLMPDFLNASPDDFAVMIKFANERRLPVAGGMDFAADGGALFNLVTSNAEHGRLSAILADKIFKGIPAGSIPVVTPESRLRINYKAIQGLGLKVSEGLLSQADEIIR